MSLRLSDVIRNIILSVVIKINTERDTERVYGELKAKIHRPGYVLKIDKIRLKK